MSAQARKANNGIDLTGKTAVIAGGSQGIGAGTAIRFAQAGANIIVIGRSQERLGKVVSEARKVAKSADQKFDYVSADLSLVSGTKTAAKEIEAKTNSKVEYLIQTQGGMPNGLHMTTAEGIESHFAVQVLNRFLLNYILASSGVLKNTSVSVMAPGGTETEFNLDDIELTSSKDAGRYALMGKQISRDSVVADTYTKALQSKFPQIKFPRPRPDGRHD
jgi:NADP-dependent 3-hydroxy acid dehydrogenase YdfG